MTFKHARRIAEEVVSGFNPNLEMLAAIPMPGGSDYFELWLVDKGCGPEPCRHLVGASRTPSEATFRRQLLEQLRDLKQPDIK